MALWVEGEGGGSPPQVIAKTRVRQVRHSPWAQTLKENKKLSNQDR